MRLLKNQLMTALIGQKQNHYVSIAWLQANIKRRHAEAHINAKYVKKKHNSLTPTLIINIHTYFTYLIWQT